MTPIDATSVGAAIAIVGYGLAIYGSWHLYKSVAPERPQGQQYVGSKYRDHRAAEEKAIEARKGGGYTGFKFLMWGSVLQLVGAWVSGFLAFDRHTSPLPAIWNEWLWSNGPADWATVAITGVAVVAAFRTLRAIRDQVTANADAAAAAKQSAETAEKQLRVAFQPYFDLKEAFATPENVYTNDQAYMTVGYTIYNASTTPARVFRLDHGYKALQGGDNLELSASGKPYDTTIAPERGYRAPIKVELSDEARQAYVNKKLVIDVMYRIWFNDPFGGEHQQTMTRQMLCGPAILQSNRGSFTGLTDDDSF